MSTHDSTTDIQAKYQKLATEYAKLRAQVGVLKKGVLDEQAKCSQLSESAKEKETQMRKQEGEMESVMFRNQQLTKRINVLQDEIESLEAKSHKSRWRGSSSERKDVGKVSSAHANIVNEELVSKITENARLQSTLADIEKQYEDTIRTLKANVQDLENEKLDLSRANETKERELSVKMRTSSDERDSLSSRLSQLESQLRSSEERNLQLQLQLEAAAETTAAAETLLRRPDTADKETQYVFVDRENEERREEERESLLQRLETAATRVREAEQGREHWKLEFQLLQMKNDKMKNENPTRVEERESEEIWDLRENELKSLFEEKVCQLVSDRLHADSKAVAFYFECEALQHRLGRLNKEKEKLDTDLSASVLLEQRLKEEVGTTRSNYEGQLSVMSDHLASMNIRLAEQTDTIEQLKFELSTKSSKKSKK